MRLKIIQPSSQVQGHTDYCTGVGWTKTNKQYELYSVADDQLVLKWNPDGSLTGKVLNLAESGSTPNTTSNNFKDPKNQTQGGAAVYATTLQFVPSVSSKGSSDATFAVACTDGSFRLVSKTGREEKRVDNAHRGAVISLRWNFDGSALATCGEDGCVRIWSRSGMPRSTLTQQAKAVYAVCWSPDSESVLFSVDKRLVSKPLQPGQKQVEWKAHDGVALQIDWSPVNNLIISGGEDCKYKIWDSFGRLLFASAPLVHVVSSIAWSPNGRYFAVGSHNIVKLCDKSGWAYCRVDLPCGSVTQLAWCEDGTQLAMAGASGLTGINGGSSAGVVIGHVTERSLRWKHLEASLEDSRTVLTKDLLKDSTHEVEFRDQIMDVSLNFGVLLATTGSQCHIYRYEGPDCWSPPLVEDLKEPATLIVQCPYQFALVDAMGINVYSYDGRMMSTVRYPGLRAEFLNSSTVSLSKDAIALVDTANPKIIRVFDVLSSKPLGPPMEHTQDVIQVALNTVGSGSDRKIAILDKSRSLYLSPAHKVHLIKLNGMVDSFMWNDETDMLVAVADSKLVCWHFPAATFVDKDLLPLTMSTKDATDCGKYSQLISFSGPHITVRRLDGALVALSVTPFAALLYQQYEKGAWDKAIRLCRFVKAPYLWASLAAMALHARELHTAEIALAAIEEVDKVQYISRIIRMPSDVRRAAELALLYKRPEEAVQTLVSNKMIYRAIKTYIRLHRWEAALSLALDHRTHVDTVLAYRQKFLSEMNHGETNPQFIQLNKEVAFDWQTVKTKIAVEKENERKNAQPGGM